MNNFIPSVLILVIVVAGYFYIYPTYLSVQDLRAENAEYELALRNLDELEDRRTTLTSKLNALSQEERNKIERMVPTELNLPLLTLDLNGIATSNGVRIDSVASEPLEAEQELGRAHITITFETTYSSFLNFLKDVEQSAFILDLVSTSYEETKDPENSTDTGTYSLTFQTYWIEQL